MTTATIPADRGRPDGPPRTVGALRPRPAPERDFRVHPAHPPLHERIDRPAETSRRPDGE